MARITRARRAELARRAHEIRRLGQLEGRSVPEIAVAIARELPELLPLEVWRLAYGWSRPQVLVALAGLYEADGLEPPPLNTAMLCRWEHGTVNISAGYEQMLCRLYGVTQQQLRQGVEATPEPSATTISTRRVTVGESAGGERSDPMRRRTLLATGLAIPTVQALEDSLALLPTQVGRPQPVERVAERLKAARRQYDTSALADLVAGLPALLAIAQETAERTQTPQALALAADAYGLATDTLNKIGRKDSARIAADRAMQWAALSEDPVAIAAASRAHGMMIRKSGNPRLGAEVMTRGIDRLQQTSLRSPAQAWTYVRLLCARAYTLSWAGDRARALAGIAEAERAAERLSALLPPMAGPFVRLYRVDIHLALGDAGTALHVGRDLHEGMWRTPERRARLHTDLARAWWQWGKPEQTAHALLAAHVNAPAEVRDRPTIRAIAEELVERHPRRPGVRELAAAIGHRRL